jgi:hypothetical protein
VTWPGLNTSKNRARMNASFSYSHRLSRHCPARQLALSGVCAAARLSCDPAAAPQQNPMTDVLPDRLSLNPKSPFHDAALLERGVGIRFNGEEKTNVEEYCVSEGWIRVAVGKSLDRRGNAMTFKLQGTVLPYFLDSPPQA